MQELITKMAICLLIALALGFLFGWLLKRAFGNKEYSSIIDAQKADLTQSKDALKMSQEESSLIKEQFMQAQDESEASALKITQLQEKIGDYSAKFSMLESNIQDRELHIQEEEKQKSYFKTQLEAKNHEFEEMVKESASQNEMINRVKEHHALLRDEFTKLKDEKSSKDQELRQLSTMIEKHKENEVKFFDEKKAQESKLEELKSTLNAKNMAVEELGHKVKEIDNLHVKISNYKENEIKLLDEKKAQEGKLEELESILNEKKIAAIELRNIVKEMDVLKQRNSSLEEKLQQSEKSFTDTQEKIGAYKKNTKIQVDKDFFNKLKESASEKIARKRESITRDTKSSKESFSLLKFAKKAFDYVPNASKEIKKNADKVIKEYKNRTK